MTAVRWNTKDGVKPRTREEDEMQLALNWQLLKQFTMEIVKMDVICLIFPVSYHASTTFMKRANDLFSFSFDTASVVTMPAKARNDVSTLSESALLHHSTFPCNQKAFQSNHWRNTRRPLRERRVTARRPNLTSSIHHIFATLFADKQFDDFCDEVRQDMVSCTLSFPCSWAAAFVVDRAVWVIAVMFVWTVFWRRTFGPSSTMHSMFGTPL
jgi:hypothetical protein